MHTHAALVKQHQHYYRIMTAFRIPFLPLLTLLFIGFSHLPLAAQRGDGELVVTGRIEQSYEPVSSGQLRIYENNRLIAQENANGRGRFSFSLPLEGEFVVAFTAPGLVTKRLMFDTRVADKRTRSRYFDFDFVVDLFPEIDGIDFTFFEEPLSTIAFINEINRFFFRENETSPRLRRANEIHRQVVDLIRRRESYALSVKQADEFFNNRNYEQARTSYREAHSFLPDETYPPQRIEQIDQILAETRQERQRQEQQRQEELARQQEEERQKAQEQQRQQQLARQSQKEQQQELEHQKQLEVAQQQEEQRKRQLEQQQQEELAQQKERERLALQERQRQEEQERQQELAKQQEEERQRELEKQRREEERRLQEEQQNRQQLAQQQQVQQQYENAIAMGDREFAAENYVVARVFYQNAQGIKPEATYPGEQLSEIENRINRQEMARQRALAQQREQELQQLEQQEHERQQTLLAEQRRQREQQAQQSREEQERQEQQRQQETALKREREQQQLAEQQRLAAQRQREQTQQQAQQKAQNRQAGNQAYEREYNSAVENGDRLFQRRQLFEARDAYQLALSHRPASSHPQERIREINEMLASSAEMERFYASGHLDVSNVREQIFNNDEKRFFFVPFDRRRVGSYLMLEAENMEGKPLRLFINYGKDSQRLGGFSVNIGGHTGVTDLRIDISGQNRWITEDNNWISIYPLGGNIDLHNLKIHFGPGQ